MSEEETIKSFKSLMYNAKANWDYFSYEILFNFFSLYNNAIEENKKLNEYKENYIPKQEIKDKIRKNEEIIDISNDGDLIHELLHKNKVYEELLESEE